MTASELKKSILQMAVEGKLTEQSEKDEPIEELLKRIKEEKESLIKEGKIKKEKTISEIYKKDGSYYERVSDGKNILKDACIDEELPFEIPDTWTWVRLGNLILLTSGQDLSNNKYNSLEKGIPYITGASSIENEEVIINRWTEYPTTIAYKNSLLLTCKGTVGTMAFLNCEKAHIARQIMAIFPLFKMNLNYIKIFLESFVNILKSSAKSMIPGITRDNVLSILFPLPPIEEQKRIVEKINLLMPLINEYDELEKSITKLNKEFPDNIKKSILQYAIEGKLTEQSEKDEPVEKLLKRIKEEREKLIKEGKIKKDKTTSEIYKKDGSYYERVFEGDNIVKDVCIDDELPFEIPDSWAWIRISNLGFFSSGKTPKEDELSTKGQYPYFKVSDMNTKGNELYLIHTNKFLSKYYNKKLFSKGTIVFPKNGGAVFTNKKRILYQDSLVDLNTGTYTIFSYNYDDYVFYLFKTIDFSKYYKGTALPTIDYELVEKILFPLPPIEEQGRIVDKINRVNEVINTIKI
ncbi:restriction endonuclease subunit S [Brachyspira pilosicoli]|uniref:restriction endonuclease subunit S n=1 Tax=Brachyspira pilosicoli TaxID=52584 RepID=UPI0012F4E27B|nr:restriction endonuclease subunit S [Brachyspira pilosicoli]